MVEKKHVTNHQPDTIETKKKQKQTNLNMKPACLDFVDHV